MSFPNLSVLSQASSTYGFTLLDALLILVFLFYAVEAYAAGFLVSLFEFGSFVISFLIGLRWYGLIGGLLVYFFSIPQGFANALGFFVLATLSELAFNILARRFPAILYDKIKEKQKLLKANHVLGIFPGLASAAVLLAFLLTLIVSLPLSPYVKQIVSGSRIGSSLIAHTTGLEKTLNGVFGGAVNETLNFFTVSPGSEAFVQLRFNTTNVSEDSSAEQEMFALVNKEREKRGFAPLIFDSNLRALARAHSTDMFARGYFSHYTPEGLSPFDRMEKANIPYNYAGENLALAPNTQLAMQGLMESPGHKANILSPNFKRVGIGVIDGGIYGEMFTQEFTD